MYLAYAVPQNGPAAPELRRRCAWLHHGLGPHSPTEYKVAGAIFSAPVARLRSDQSVITVEVVDWECSASRLALTRARSAASALTRPRSQSSLLAITSAETADARPKNPSYPHGLTRNAPYKVHPLARDANDHLVEVPAIARPRTALPQPSCNPGPEFQNPAPYRLIGNIEATLGEELFDVAIAQCEPEIKPDSVLDDWRREGCRRLES